MAASAAFSSVVQGLNLYSHSNQRACERISLTSPFVANFPSLSAKLSFPSSSTSLSGNGLLSVALGSAPICRRSSIAVYARAAAEQTIHDYTVKDIDGKDVSLDKFKGKVLLIVNVASKCGLTTSNYKELSQMYGKYKSQGKSYSEEFVM